MLKNNISFYFQHGAAISVEKNGEYFIFELERLVKKRYFSLLSVAIDDALKIINDALNILQYHYNIDNQFDTCVFPGYTLRAQAKTLPLIEACRNLISANKYVLLNHHLSHAACAAYQSPYASGLVISFDGSGNDGRFNLYNYDKTIEHITRLDVPSFGKCYRQVAFILQDIEKVKNGKAKLMVGYAGKLMGLVAYGKVRNDWIEGFSDFYQTGNLTKLKQTTGLLHINEDEFLTRIKNDIAYTQYSGQLAYDLAATNQYVFEKEFFNLVDSFIDDRPIIIAGGCGLNVLLNENIRLRYGNRVFVPPNTDDSGISLGQLFLVNPPTRQIDVTYCGFPILDLEEKDTLLAGYYTKNIDINEISLLLKQGHIFGVIMNKSEIGPRALGNRSILCDPSFPNMKDKLNKIKNREWFRPFAPVVRFEDRNKYFEFDYESRFMSFSPKVRNEYQKMFPSITHVDGTARVQTVTSEQNEFLYNLLGQTNVLLNTSFNINGTPMITSIKDALTILNTTDLDHLIVQDKLVSNINF
jgi:carbamoyltransferase